MATYSSYKKISGASLTNESVTDAKLEATAFKNYDVKWIRGCLGSESPGCCCLWTVPTGVTRVTFELWGAGGNGHGLCVNNRCCLLYTSPSPRDATLSRMPSSA